MTATDFGRTKCPTCGGIHTARQACAPAPEAAAAQRPADMATDLPQRGAAIVQPALAHQAARAAGPTWPAAERWVAPARRAGFAVPSPSFVWPERRRRRVNPVRRVLKVAGCATGTVALISSLTLAGTEVGELTQAGTDAGVALMIIAIALAVGVTLGMGVLWVSSRLYAKIVFAMLAVFLLTAGTLMLVLAPVLRQVDTPQVAEYSAFSALLWFGVAAMICGVALGAACVRWALERDARRRLERWARLLGSAYGVMLGISGVFGVLSVALSGVNGGGDVSTVEQALNLTALAMWSLVPGLILTYHGISASMGEGSSEFHVPHASVLIATFAALISLGWALMRMDPPLAAPMPILHALAAALPGAAMVAMAARGGVFRGSPVRRLSWRQVMLAVAISMTVGVWLALYVESVGSFCSVVLLLVHNGAFASVKDSDAFFRTLSDSDVILTHNEQFFANLITASLFAPVIEEFGKGLGVRLMLRRDTTRAQAFVMGAAAGAGFGFLEAMLYGVAGVHQDGPGNWPAIMLVRGGSTSLHVANTALVGLGWWYIVNARPKTGCLLFAVAVLNHAAWNGFATAIDSRILGLDTFSGHVLEIVAYVFVALISGAFIAGVPILGRRLQRADARAPVSGPITELQPWMG